VMLLLFVLLIDFHSPILFVLTHNICIKMLVSLMQVADIPYSNTEGRTDTEGT
jgi:hypothetical protein